MTVTATDVHVELGGTAILDGISLSVTSGEFVCIVGPNGAGKTTLLSTLAGEYEPSSGSVAIDGVAPSSLPVVERALTRAYLAQTDRTDVPYDVETVVGFGTHLAEIDAVGRSETVRQAMLAMEIEHLAERTVSSLSGGERRRVALARVLAQQSDVLILDEPTDSLDLAHADLVATVSRRRAREGNAVIASSHDLNLAAKHADRAVVLRSGSVVAEGIPAEILEADMLSEVYECTVTVLRHPEDGRPIIVV